MKTANIHILSDPSIKEKIRRFYDLGSPYYLQEFGKHIHDGYYITGRELREKAQENLIRFLAEKANIQPGSSILDVGSGVGGSSIWLAKNLQAQTTGITISQVQLDIARRLAQNEKVNSQFLLMDADQMKFSEPFDYLWILAALTHFTDQEKFLKTSREYLKPGGKLVIYDWTLSENLMESSGDGDIKSVMEGMVISNLCPTSSYIKWLEDAGYGAFYAEDITEHTVKTWEGALSLFLEPRIWKLLFQSSSDERKEIITFFQGFRAIKRAMLKGKVRSTAIVAENML